MSLRRCVAWQRSYSFPRPLIRRSRTHLVLHATRTVCGREIPKETPEVVLLSEGTGLCKNCMNGLRSRGGDPNLYLTAEERARRSFHQPILVEVDPARYTESRQDFTTLKSLAMSDFDRNLEAATAWAHDAIDRGMNVALATFDEMGNVDALTRFARDEFGCSDDAARVWAEARTMPSGSGTTI